MFYSWCTVILWCHWRSGICVMPIWCHKDHQNLGQASGATVRNHGSQASPDPPNLRERNLHPKPEFSRRTFRFGKKAIHPRIRLDGWAPFKICRFSTCSYFKRDTSISKIVSIPDDQISTKLYTLSFYPRSILCNHPFFSLQRRCILSSNNTNLHDEKFSPSEVCHPTSGRAMGFRNQKMMRAMPEMAYLF